MAIANNEQQVEWSAADYIDLTSGSPTATSDAITLGTACYDAMITIKADNQGATPASGDIVYVYGLLSCGETDGDGTGAGNADFPASDIDGIFLAALDTYTDSPANGIVTRTVNLPVAAPYLKIYGKSEASANTIRLSACINEKTDS